MYSQSCTYSDENMESGKVGRLEACCGHPFARTMTAPCPLLGDGVTDDTLLHIVSFITTARDLLRLQLTSKRFGARCIAAPSSGGGGPANATAFSVLLDDVKQVL